MVWNELSSVRCFLLHWKWNLGIWWHREDYYPIVGNGEKFLDIIWKKKTAMITVLHEHKKLFWVSASIQIYIWLYAYMWVCFHDRLHISLDFDQFEIYWHVRLFKGMKKSNCYFENLNIDCKLVYILKILNAS